MGNYINTMFKSFCAAAWTAAITSASMQSLRNEMTASAKVNIIGYYGNSGGAPSFITKLVDINVNYNVLILTFGNIQANGSVKL